MKSPLKVSKWPIVLYTLIGVVLIGAISNSFYLSGAKFTLSRIIISLATILLFALAGWLMAYVFESTFLHRKVDHPITEPGKILKEGQTYWLNGQTPAIFLGAMDHTGKYIFHIEGLNKKDRPESGKDLTPDQVRQYISLDKEI